jgi:Tol biopolymer transport system component
MPLPSGHRTLRPPAPPQGAAEMKHARLSPDERRLAYVRADGAGSSVFLADPETGWSRKLAGYAAAVSDLAFAPGGELVAYVVGGPLTPPAERVVAWALTTAPGEQGRVAGTAFAWSPRKPALYVADPKERALVHHDLATGKPRKLADLPDDGILGLPPRIAVAPGASRIAFTARHARRNLADVWIVARDSEATSVSLLTQVPNARTHVEPFWSPGAGSIGLSIVFADRDKSGIVLVPKLQGDGEIYREVTRLDAPVAPAWSPSSRYIAFQAADGEGTYRLSLLDCRERTVEALLDPAPGPAGAPRFLSANRLAIEGGAAVHVHSFDEPL